MTAMTSLLRGLFYFFFGPLLRLAEQIINLPRNLPRGIRWVRNHPGRTLWYVANHFIALGVTVIFVYPLVWLLSASLKPPFEIYREPLRLIPSAVQTDVYDEILRAGDFPTYLNNSVLYSTGASLLTLLLAVLAAYGLSRYRFSGKRTLMILILAMQMIPGLVTVIPMYILMNQLGLYNTQHGIILLYSTLQIPWTIWVMKGYFDTIPVELDEAALIDGASRLRALRQIILPLVAPGIAASFLIIFMARWNEFALANALLSNPQLHPLPVGTFRLLGPDEADFRLTAAASLVNIVPILAVFAVLQRFLVSGLASGAVKG
ncbi:MAG: carbohydrate ABC transporter permease [Anaerolineae bacterium]|nr:carbohydrate ABC transporter permease [Anaerolineae bacterium]